LKVEEQVVVIYAGTSGLLDPLPLDRVKEFENGLLRLMRSEHDDLLDKIREKGEMTEDITANVKSILERYAKNFA
jgi:F-type H+-transporting ATPase subunit alpha